MNMMSISRNEKNRKFGKVGKLVLSSKTNGEAAPNAVIQIKEIEPINTANDVSLFPGLWLAKKILDADWSKIIFQECHYRPFKCKVCGVGFRVSGHLTRHQKSRSHILKIQLQGMVSYYTPLICRDFKQDL